MSTNMIAGSKCLRKKPPFYECEKGWCIDTRKNDPDVGYIHISAKWYRTLNEAKADYPKQYQLAKNKKIKKTAKSPRNDEKMKFSKFLELFSEYRLTKVRASTFYHLDKFVQKTFLQKFMGKEIKDIFTQETASNYKRKVLATDLTKAYKNKALGYYRQMCDYAFGSGLLNPDQYAWCKFATESLTKEEEVAVKTKQAPFALTDNEVDRLLSVIDNPVHLMLTKFLFATGFRLSEALAITPREIDFNRGMITREYQWGMTEIGTEGRLHRTKNNNEATFPASESLLNELLQYINKHHIGDDEMLFYCSTDLYRPVESQWYRKKLRAYCRKAGIREIHPHIARHTFCTKVAALTGSSNADKKALEILTGHTESVNQGVYNHAEEETMRNIVNMMNRK